MTVELGSQLLGDGERDGGVWRVLGIARLGKEVEIHSSIPPVMSLLSLVSKV